MKFNVYIRHSDNLLYDAFPGALRYKRDQDVHRKLELNLKRSLIWHEGVVQTYLSPKKDRTVSQHDGVCFLYSNFSPHKPIPRDAFMPVEVLDFH